MTNKPKIIVLDLDGPVFNTRSELLAFIGGKDENGNSRFGSYDLLLVHMLRKACEEHGHRIVIISDRRAEPERCFRTLCSIGLDRWLDKDWCLPMPIGNETRGQVLDRWSAKRNDNSYVVIDDQLMGYAITLRRCLLVQATYHDGVSAQEMLKLQSILF